MATADKAKGFVGEFKEFISRGNVMDMAVGVIIGGAFGKISTSLVNDIIMPFISILTGGINFESWKWVLKAAELDAEGNVVTEAVSVNFGTFLATILDFIIVAFAIFCVIKAINAARRKKEEEPEEEPAPPEPTKEELLLTEIRDLLKKK